MHIFDNLVRRARTEPDGVFCRILKGGADTVITNAAIVAEAVGFARRLRASGVAAGEIVPIVLEHRRELYGSFIGCTLAGAVPAFLPPLTHKQDPAAFRHSMQALLQRIGPACVIASAATMPTIGLGGVATIDVDAPAAAHGAEPAPPMPPGAAPGDLALLQHSSGTTGLKKGVCLSHGVVLRQVEDYAAALQLTRHDSVASWLPLYHDMGLISSFITPAITGIPIVGIDALEWVVQPTILLDAIARYRATLCWMPNFAFHHLARLAEPGRQWDLGSLRMMVSCSEPCRASAFEVFLDRFAASSVRPEMLQVSYAMAENVFAVTQTRPGSLPRRSRHPVHGDFLSCGATVGNTRLRVVGVDGTLVRDDAVGEVLIRGDCLFGGYFRQPDLMAARMRDGWFATGDLGFCDAGELFVVGRTDDVLNINGRKLIAHEIEDALNGVAGVAPGRVLVYAEHDGQSGAAHLIVLAERLAGATADDAELAAAIRRGVVASCGMRPNRVAFRPRGFLLKSTSGKISRAASIAKIRASADLSEIET